MKKKTKLIIGVSVLVVGVALAINAYYMGICIVHSGGFDWAQGDIFEDIFPGEDNFISITNGRFRGLIIPNVIRVGLLSSAPYDVSFDVQDRTLSFTEIVIDSIEVEYKDGFEEKKQLDLRKGFKPWPIYTSIEGELMKIPANGVKIELDAVVTKDQSCAVKMHGHFVTKDGEIPFNTSNYFEYEPASWGINMYLNLF